MHRREFLKLAGAVFMAPEMNKLSEILGIKPDRGRVFSQLDPEWADRELPGKKPTWLGKEIENKVRVAGCSAMALAHVINLMVDEVDILRLTGKPVLTPVDLIYDIFPKLPNFPLVMSAMGGNANTVTDCLRFFGLSYDVPSLSKYTMSQNLEEGQMAIVGINLKDVNGYIRTHYTIYSRTDLTGATFVKDSYFGGGGKEVRLDSYLPVWDIISVIRISNRLDDRTKNN